MTTPATNLPVPFGRQPRRLSGFGRAPVLVSAAVLACWADAARGQDALRLSLSNDSAAAQRRLDLENLPYTLRLGDFKMLTSASMEAEYNSNITLVNSGAEGDLVLRPLLKEGFFWPVTEVNLLTFSLGAGYQAFLQHPSDDLWLITPDSAVQWDLYLPLGWRLNVHDQFSYEQDPTAWGAISGTATYGGFYNTAGVLGSFDSHDVKASLGYDHFNFDASSAKYNYLSRGSDFVTGRASLQVHPTAIVGFEVSGGPTAYSQRLLSDNTTYSAGAFSEWHVSQEMLLKSRGGYYLYDFSEPSLSGGVSSQTGYYFSLEISHWPRKSFSYGLGCGLQAFMGNNSALTEQWHGTLWTEWRAASRLTLASYLRYETATMPVAFALNDDYSRLFGSLKAVWRFGERLSASLQYLHILKDSSQAPLSYGPAPCDARPHL